MAPLLVSFVWFVATLVTAYINVPVETAGTETGVRAAAEIRIAIPSKPQTAPEPNSNRYASIEALHLKFKVARADTGFEPALCPDLPELRLIDSEFSIHRAQMIASAAEAADYFSARAPPYRLS